MERICKSSQDFTGICPGWVENIVGKEENTVNHHLLCAINGFLTLYQTTKFWTGSN